MNTKGKWHAHRVNERAEEILREKRRGMTIRELQARLGFVGVMSYDAFRRHVHRVLQDADLHQGYAPVSQGYEQPPAPSRESLSEQPPAPSRESPSEASPQSLRRKRGFVSARVGRDPVDLDPQNWRKLLSKTDAEDDDKKDRK